MPRRRKLQFEETIQVTAAPTQVIAASFDSEALAVWWHAVRSVTTPRPLGVYAIEWETTSFQDDVLGSLGGVFYGTVMEFHPGRSFLVTDAYWLLPQQPGKGPMALEVTCQIDGPATSLHVRQSGSENSEHWACSYELVSSGWSDSLAVLKNYLEQGAEPRLPARGQART